MQGLNRPDRRSTANNHATGNDRSLYTANLQRPTLPSYLQAGEAIDCGNAIRSDGVHHCAASRMERSVTVATGAFARAGQADSRRSNLVFSEEGQ